MTPGRKLVLFATSSSPDPYVNVACHCVMNAQVSSVDIVVVAEPGGQAVRATEVQARMMDRFSELATVAPGRPNQLAPAEAQVYANVAQRLNSGGIRAQVVQYDHLSDALNNWVDGACIIDVTTLDKKLSIEVASVLMSMLYREAYSFRFLRPPTHGDSDLYHRMNVGADYEYARIVDTPPMRRALERSRRWTIDAKWFGAVSLFAVVGTAALSWQGQSAFMAALNNFASVLGVLGAVSILIRRGTQ